MIFAKPWCQTNYQNPKRQPWKKNLVLFYTALHPNLLPIYNFPQNSIMHIIQTQCNTQSTLRTRKHLLPQRAIKAKGYYNIFVPHNMHENKTTKCKAHRPHDFTIHHHQLPKVLLPFAFGGWYHPIWVSSLWFCVTLVLGELIPGMQVSTWISHCLIPIDSFLWEPSWWYPDGFFEIQFNTRPTWVW